MAIDFPGSPSNGQRHSHNNTTWEWDGSSWNRITIDLSTTDATTVVGLAVTQFARRDDDNIITGVTTFIGNGYTGVGNTVLIVEGDARVTGVLSIGQGSVSINERDISAVGVITGANFKTGTTNVHNVGVELAGVNVLGADTPIGTGATVYNSGLIVSKAGAEYQGVVTASSFKTSGGGNITLGDSSGASDDRIVLGAGSDLSIYHNGSNSYISDTGALYIQGVYVVLESTTGENYFKGTSNGAVELYHNNIKTFETVSGGAKVTGDLDVTGHIDVADNVRLKLGTHDDINIFHDGTNSTFENSGGNLTIQNDVAGGNLYLKGKSGEHSIICNRDGAVEIYHDNAKKLESTSGGINVDGKAIIDGVDVTQLTNGATTNGIFLNAGDTGAGNRPYIDLKGAGTDALSGKALRVYYDNGGTESFYVDYEGNISGKDITIQENIVHSGDTDTKIYFSAANTFKIQTGGTDRVTVTNATTTVANDLSVAGDATFSGNVSIGKTLTYEDVKNIDSVGVVTARSGFEITSGTFKANSQVGAAGSVLGSTGSGVNWISPLTGPQGAQGAQGYQGVQGAQGHQGVQGAKDTKEFKVLKEFRVLLVLLVLKVLKVLRVLVVEQVLKDIKDIKEFKVLQVLQVQLHIMLEL